MMKKIVIFMVFSFFSIFAESSFFSKVEEASSFLKRKINIAPELLVVLTAGIEGVEDVLQDKIIISSCDIPNFPIAKAKGHAGKLIFGTFGEKGVVLMKGRCHYYEKLSPEEVVFPYFVLNKMGVKTMITTNAVGGIRHDLNVGDIVLVKDHINFMSDNPLRGIAIQFSENQFTDMTMPYDYELRKIAIEEANSLNYVLKEGIYIATMGPSYETKSEIKMFRMLGADVVGMSTVFEVITCNFLKMKVLAFSCVSNPAADRHDGNMSHEEVLLAMNELGPRLRILIENCMKRICAIKADRKK